MKRPPQTYKQYLKSIGYKELPPMPDYREYAFWGVMIVGFIWYMVNSGL